MPEPSQMSAHDKRLLRIMAQRQKVAGLEPGSEERVIEETVLAAMLNSAAIGDLADSIEHATPPLDHGA